MKRLFLAGIAASLGLTLLGTAEVSAKTDPAAANPDLATYLDRLEVLPPKEYKGLAVYALVARKDFPLGDYQTLDDALKRGTLKVTELEGEAQVNTLLLENTGDKHVFVLAGEVLKGAKQDRTIQGDLLVPPRSGKLKISAFCTEQGRWAQKTAKFEAADVAVPNSVRKAAKATKEQGRVWDSILATQNKLRVSAPSGAAKEIYESRSVQGDMKPYLEKLSALPKLDGHAVGVAATFGDKLVALDVFGDDALFDRLYSKLLRSYVVDVLGDTWRGSTTTADIKKWLEAAREASWTKGETDGVGLGLEFKQPPLSGSALLYKEMVVHSDIFLADKEIREDDRNPPPRLDIRRHDLQNQGIQQQRVR